MLVPGGLCPTADHVPSVASRRSVLRLLDICSRVSCRLQLPEVLTQLSLSLTHSALLSLSRAHVCWFHLQLPASSATCDSQARPASYHCAEVRQQLLPLAAAAAAAAAALLIDLRANEESANKGN